MKEIIKGKKYYGEMSVLAVNMPAEDYDALKHMAIDKGVNVSTFIRGLIAIELQAHKKERDENLSAS